MADQTERLLLQVDAATELLRRNLAAGEQPLDRFEKRTDRMAANVDASIAKMGTRFGEFAKLAETAADRAKRSFEASFSDVEKLAAKAIQSPSSQGGLNVGAADARAAASAAQQRAAATRQIAEAAERAAAGEGVLTEQTRLYIQAARAATIEADRRASELTKEAAALERLEIELASAGAGHRVFGAEQAKVTATSGAQRAAMAGLSYQIQDTFTQLSMGANAFQVIAIQGGQAAGQFAHVEGKAGSFARFLIGPWGLAITAAMLVLGPLVSKVVEFGDETEKAVDKLREDAKQTEIAKNAKAIFGRTVDGVTIAIREQNEALGKSIQTQRESAQAAIAAANAQLQVAQATRVRTAAELRAAVTRAELLRNTQDDATTGADGGIDVAGVARDTIVARAQAEIRQLRLTADRADAAVAAGVQGVRLAQIPLARINAQSAASPTGAADRRFEQQQSAIEAQFKKDGNFPAYQAALNKATIAHQEEVDAIREANRKARGKSPEALARAAEAARQKGLSDDIRFSDLELAARKKLIDATGKYADTTAARDKLERDEINAEFASERDKIALRQSKGQLSAAEAARLNALNEETKAQRLRNVDIAAAQRLIARGYDIAQGELDSRIAILRINQDLAITERDRRTISRQILEAEQELRRKALERIRDTSNDPEAVAKANRDLARLPAIEAAERKQNDHQNAGPLDQYKERLQKATADMSEALDNVKAHGLQSLEDGLTNIISGTEDVGTAFKRMANSIIADLVRIAVQKVILGIFGLKDGGPVVKHMATGGFVSGPGGPREDRVPAMLSAGEFVVTADATRRHLPLLRALNSGALRGFAAGGPVNLRAPTISTAGPAAASVGGSVLLQVSLSDDLNARIDNRAAGVSVQVMRQSVPGIVDTARAAFVAEANRPRL